MIMNTKIRIKICKLLEKSEKNGKLSKSLGINDVSYYKRRKKFST